MALAAEQPFTIKNNNNSAISMVTTLETRPKVSFCTTCRGADYLERLKQTLPENIARNVRDDAPEMVEFVVVAYGDRNVTNWLVERFPDEIRAGIVKVVDLPVEQAPHFRMSHAKNVAHRMATGDVLCNLDCDNITSQNFAEWLSREFSKDPDIIVAATTRGKLIGKITRGQSPQSLAGRIAISRDHFMELHGYDENFSAWGGEDTNFERRAMASGIRMKGLPPLHFGQVLQHDNESRYANMSEADRHLSAARLSEQGRNRLGTLLRILGLPDHDPSQLSGANQGGEFGCATVSVVEQNMQEVTRTLVPEPSPEWMASFTEAGKNTLMVR